MQRASLRLVFAAFLSAVFLPANADTNGSAEAPFQQRLEWDGITFDIRTVSRDGKTVLQVQPSGLSIDNSILEQTIEGNVSGAEIADLNVDQSPEIYIYVLDHHQPPRMHLYAWSANHRKSMSMIYLPELSDDPALAQGYVGGDEMSVLEGVLGRRFVIHDNGQPTGKYRQMQYKLKPGEASWQLVLDRVTEF
ncbi:MAG TPA: hypothetical protein PK027_10530 [Aquimonas sp.]|nr:hypothetical protein [Xanthomonadales bacterium]HRD73885.1 hypothetical protein [Aquimonas sp.]HRF54878.1 hypothetical protein [Aquimonas sp.]